MIRMPNVECCTCGTLPRLHRKESATAAARLLLLLLLLLMCRRIIGGGHDYRWRYQMMHHCAFCVHACQKPFPAAPPLHTVTHVT
jgi:hypothetical protein